MGWLNIFGLVFIVTIMIPNIVFAVKCKEGFANKYSNKTAEIIEQIGRFGCFGFMIFNIPGTCFGFASGNLFSTYLIVDFVLVFAYCIIWIFWFKKNNLFRAVALSVLPSFVFFFSGILSRSLLLTFSALIFAPCHIAISVKGCNIKK